MYTFNPGNYVVVPSTKQPGLVGNFWITIFCPNSTSAKVTCDFSEPDVHRVDLPIDIPDPYELCDKELQEFVERRRKYFLFSQVIDRGDRDASFRLDRSSSMINFSSPTRGKVKA